MSLPGSRSTFFLLSLFILSVSAHALSKETTPSSLTEDQKCLQVLNRLTFGPKPGELKRVQEMGIPAFLEEQLHPERLDDSACEKDLQRYPTLNESANSLFMEYPEPGNNLLRPDLRDKELSPKERDEAYERIQSIQTELSSAKLTRILESRRQLYEVMVDFWFNHFNVDFEKNEDQWLLTSYERDAIRPYALGKFRDLLGAVAKSPAMQVYLNNFENFADPNFKPHPMGGGMGGGGMMMQSAPAEGALRINENYARELLELHTLGVDGGYTQKDVSEAARVLTGWAVQGIRSDAEPQPIQFQFKPWHHDTNPKVVLGQTFGPNDGVNEGEALLDMLCKKPATARHIAFKLCQRFVVDNPPDALVKRVADRFLETEGDIKETLMALIHSPEFFSPRYYRAKVKTPLEFMASSLRALDAHPSNWQPAIDMLETMGEPLYMCPPPTGYPQTANAWVSSDSLLGRANFAAKLFNYTENGAPIFDFKPLEKRVESEGSKAALENACRIFLNGEVSNSTRKALFADASGGEAPEAKKVVAWVMASPDFQKR